MNICDSQHFLCILVLSNNPFHIQLTCYKYLKTVVSRMIVLYVQMLPRSMIYRSIWWSNSPQIQFDDWRMKYTVALEGGQWLPNRDQENLLKASILDVYATLWCWLKINKMWVIWALQISYLQLNVTHDSSAFTNQSHLCRPYLNYAIMYHFSFKLWVLCYMNSLQGGHLWTVKPKVSKNPWYIL